MQMLVSIAGRAFVSVFYKYLVVNAKLYLCLFPMAKINPLFNNDDVKVLSQRQFNPLRRSFKNINESNT